MKPLVMKFGGASLATSQSFLTVAKLIIARFSYYSHIVVVVSAMGSLTDQLLSLAREVHPSPPCREQDMLVSTGERISMALLAMALTLQGKEAISFTGSQSGIITTDDHSEAKIIEVRPNRVFQALELGKIPIIAGFQGVSRKGEITTLGRGGSDVTAVALAVALGAEIVEFYKDVGGIFDADPKTNPEAQFLSTLSYDRALDLTTKGAKVLHSRCVALAKSNGVQLHILPFSPSETTTGSYIGCGAVRNPIYMYESPVKDP